MRTSRRALIGVTVLLALAVAPAAQADTKTVRDGNDVATALDIRSVSQGHARSRVTHSLRTYGAFSSRFLQGDNIIGFGFDTNHTARSAERFVFVFWAGRLRAAVTNRSGDFIAWARVSRPSSHSVKGKVSRGSLNNPTGYRWAAFTVVGRALTARRTGASSSTTSRRRRSSSGGSRFRQMSITTSPSASPTRAAPD